MDLSPPGTSLDAVELGAYSMKSKLIAISVCLLVVMASREANATTYTLTDLGPGMASKSTATNECIRSQEIN